MRGLYNLVLKVNCNFIAQEHFQKLRIETAMGSSEATSKQVISILPIPWQLTSSFHCLAVMSFTVNTWDFSYDWNRIFWIIWTRIWSLNFHILSLLPAMSELWNCYLITNALLPACYVWIMKLLPTNWGLAKFKFGTYTVNICILVICFLDFAVHCEWWCMFNTIICNEEEKEAFKITINFYFLQSILDCLNLSWL